MIRRLLSCTFLVILCATGCHSGPRPDAQAAGSSTYKTYKLRGKIVGTKPATGELTVSHEAIPGFMEAMTMPYKLKNPGIMSDLHPGDVITADLFVSQNADADVYLDNIVVIAQGKPDYRPKVSYHVPAPGDPVPDFRLRNRDGRTILLTSHYLEEVERLCRTITIVAKGQIVRSGPKAEFMSGGLENAYLSATGAEPDHIAGAAA